MDLLTLSDESLEALRVAILMEQERRELLATAQDRIDDLTVRKQAAEAVAEKPSADREITLETVEVTAPVRGKR